MLAVECRNPTEVAHVDEAPCRCRICHRPGWPLRALSPLALAAQAPRQEQEAPRSAPRDNGVSVTAPQADVRVDGARGQVRVRAPQSSVSVDADAGQVKVRAPYVNLDVRW